MTNTQPDEPKKFSSFLVIAAIVTLGVAIYLTFTESWPVTYLIDLQAGSDGTYRPKLTFAITWIVMMVPCWLVDFIIQKIRDKNKVVKEND